jgi:hypothetical protein
MKVKFAGHFVVPFEGGDNERAGDGVASRSNFHTPRSLSGLSDNEMCSKPTENGDIVHRERKASVYRIRYVYDDSNDTMDQPIIYRRHPLTGEETPVTQNVKYGQEQLEALRPILDSMEPMVKRLVSEYKGNFAQKVGNGNDATINLTHLPIQKAAIHSPLRSREMLEVHLQQLQTNHSYTLESGFAHFIQSAKYSIIELSLDSRCHVPRKCFMPCLVAEMIYKIMTFNRICDFPDISSPTILKTSTLSSVFTNDYLMESDIVDSQDLIQQSSAICQQDRIRPVARMRRGAVTPQINQKDVLLDPHQMSFTSLDSNTSVKHQITDNFNEIPVCVPIPKPRISRGNSMDRHFPNSVISPSRKSKDETQNYEDAQTFETTDYQSETDPIEFHLQPQQRSTVYLAKVNFTVTEEKDNSSMDESTFLPISTPHDEMKEVYECEFTPTVPRRQWTQMYIPHANRKLAWISQSSKQKAPFH